MRARDFISPLLEILKEEKRVCEAALRIAQKKRDILSVGDVAELEALLPEEQDIARRFRAIENNRMRANEALALSLSIHPDEFGFSKLRDVIPPEDRKWFDAFQSEFSRIATRQKALSATNRRMIENMLECVDISITAITQNDVIINQYASDGKNVSTANELSHLRLIDVDV